jgi:hypothetical protein
MCFVLLQTAMLSMWTTMCLEPINACVEQLFVILYAYVING